MKNLNRCTAATIRTDTITPWPIIRPGLSCCHAASDPFNGGGEFTHGGSLFSDQGTDLLIGDVKVFSSSPILASYSLPR